MTIEIVPTGAAVGAVTGAVVGGLAGKAVAEAIDPTAEDTFWSRNFGSRPYVEKGRSFGDYRPAYRYGWESYGRNAGRNWDEAEPELHKGWEQARGESLDCRTDLFSLGSVLSAMCTGRPPFRAGTSLAVLRRICEGAPSLRKNPAHAVEKPLDLLGPAEKNAAQDQPGAARGIAGGIIERQGRAPRAAKDEPAVDGERGAQPLDVGNKVRRSVVGDLAERCRTPGAALIEDHDPPIGRIKEPTVHRGSTGAGTAMQKQHRSTSRVARLLPIHRVPSVEP